MNYQTKQTMHHFSERGSNSEKRSSPIAAMRDLSLKWFGDEAGPSMASPEH